MIFFGSPARRPRLLLNFILAIVVPRPSLAQVQPGELPMNPVVYHTIQIDGLAIFYREAGPKDGPTLLMLHGLPSSSRMFEPLFAKLSDRYHLIAPDYPGFGHSDWPDPKKFAYTFEPPATSGILNFKMFDAPTVTSANVFMAISLGERIYCSLFTAKVMPTRARGVE